MAEKVFSKILFLSLIVLGVAFPSPRLWALGDPTVETLDTARFILHFSKGTPSKSSPNTRDLAVDTLRDLEGTFAELSRVFNAPQNEKVVISFLSEDAFRKKTGAPPWTSAMFFNGEIMIPLRSGRGMDREDLKKTLRHEYTHAIIAKLSNSRCPAWLDEGLAQFIEGEPNPILGPALRAWIKYNEAMPFDWLHDGFTTLDNDVVPAAYAQSLFVTRTLINTKGMPAIARYLAELGKGEGESKAFETAFGARKKRFEAQTTSYIRRWAKSKRAQP